MKKFAEGFREFILRGNVVDLAVAVVVGAAFNSVVTTFANAVLLQIVAIFVGEPNFNDLFWTVNEAQIRYGEFLTALVSFLITAFAVYLVVFQHVPTERAAQLIADLTGAAPSTGWVSAQVARAGDALVEVEQLIKTLITLAAVIGVDETSVNIAGKAHWLHVARTDTLTAYFRHETRGRAAVAAFGVLPDYTGTVVHDALSVYDCYPARHGLCGAHIIRELTAGVALLTASLTVGAIYWVRDIESANVLKILITVAVWAACTLGLILRLRGRLLAKRFAWTCVGLFAAALLSLGPVDASRHPPPPAHVVPR